MALGKNMESLVKDNSGVTVVIPDALVKIYFNGPSVVRSFVSSSSCFDYHLERLGKRFRIKSIASLNDNLYVLIEPKA